MASRPRIVNRRGASDAEIARQTMRARKRHASDRKAGRVAVAAEYDADKQRLVVEMSSGIIMSVPVHAISELKEAAADEIADVTVDELGYGLHWEQLDVDVSILGLLSELVGERAVLAAAGRAGGRAKTDAKAAAARANGAKGGRPRKKSVLVGA